MRFSWTFLAGAALLGAFAIGAQIEAQHPALAQFASAPQGASDPIGRLPAPPDGRAIAPENSAKIAPKTAPNSPVAPRAKPLVISKAAPTPKPIPKLEPRFVGQKPIRVGLSTQGGPISIYAPGGATLFDLKQPAQTLSLPRGARFELQFGPNRATKRGTQTLRGPISVATAGVRLGGWQRVYIAALGKIESEAVRVSTGGTNPKWGRPYRGDLEVFSQKLGEPVKRKGPLALVNVVPLEAYLRGVVPWEMDADAPLEALKAQAICARTKTLDFIRTKRFAAGDFEVCDYDACQGYPGMENEKAATTLAVETTKGLAIYHNNRPIDAVYSTNSGGITADANDAWPGGASIPYLQSVTDFAPDSPLGKMWQSGMTEAKWAQFCAGNFDSFAKPDGVAADKYEARKYRWNQFISLAEAKKAFAGDGFGSVTGLEIGARAASGHIKTLRVSGLPNAASNAPLAPFNPQQDAPIAPQGAPKSLTLEGDGKIRAMFSKRLGSTTALPSSLFTISPTADASGKLSGWNLQGAGWGHGVGMCQRGAQNHAKQGWDARKILSWYYRGVEIR